MATKKVATRTASRAEVKSVQKRMRAANEENSKALSLRAWQTLLNDRGPRPRFKGVVQGDGNPSVDFVRVAGTGSGKPAIEVTAKRKAKKK